MKILTKFRNYIITPFAKSNLTMQSNLNYIKSLFKSDNVIIDKSYNQPKKILLLALFEKGELRQDIVNLLKVAKQQDLFVVCVNTLKLKNPKEHDELFDCYIEKYNFGRDFGSYKTGFLYLFKKHYLVKCPRLILLNDSLFYSRKNLNNFISSLSNTDIEVLGATENHEIEHHLGSFCLSLSNSILTKKKFIKYWKKFRRSDVRPKVIKYGEMKLSKTLKKCTSSPNQFQALFDITWFTNVISNDIKLIEHVSDFYRTSDFVDWNKASLRSVIQRLSDRYIHIDPGMLHIEGNVDVNMNDSIVNFAESTSGVVRHVSKAVKANDEEEKVIRERVHQELRNDLYECFSFGSQIHQNAILLHFLGMPIIKLDGLYRGMFSPADVENIANQLEEDEVVFFKRMLYSKPFGGNVLSGWKQAAFYRGLI